MIRRIIRRLITLAILAGLGFGVYWYGQRYLWPPEDRSRIDVVGIIEAPEVNLTSRIAGRITWLPAIEGDRVEKGEVVIRIEDVDIRNQFNQAKAMQAKAEADLGRDQRDLERMRTLFAEHIATTQQRDDAAATVEDDRAALESAKANVEFYGDQLRDTAIVSPVDGVIVSKALEVGEWITPGTPVLTIDDMSTIWARVDVEETQLSSIYLGKAAQVRLPTDPPQNFTGRVMAIGQEGQFATERDVRRGRQDIRTFYVKVQVLQSNGEAKPGMTAEVTFQRGNQGRDATRLTSN
ncbi:MAG TPA: efflux RND transporter periplasmic adaptor subunit [Candidatus Binataceae bacterium]|nr:efflux RND transporter periplasmic adaptor subunit [Candidatus Binataceae bacterium]